MCQSSMVLSSLECSGKADSGILGYGEQNHMFKTDNTLILYSSQSSFFLRLNVRLKESQQISLYSGQSLILRFRVIMSKNTFLC